MSDENAGTFIFGIQQSLWIDTNRIEPSRLSVGCLKAAESAFNAARTLEQPDFETQMIISHFLTSFQELIDKDLNGPWEFNKIAEIVLAACPTIRAQYEAAHQGARDYYEKAGSHRHDVPKSLAKDMPLI